MKIAIAGATGTVGTHVATVARERGHEVLALSRATGVDLVSGDGLDLGGVDAVIDVASVQTLKADVSRAFFGGVTRNLLAAERTAGVRHHVALSIVGIDGSASGYYAGKQLQEQLVRDGGVPWSVLRATQFHEFAGQVHGQATVGPFVLVPVMRSQPVAAREVAERLVELAEGEPAGRVADLGGPRVESMPAMVRRWAAATGDRRPVIAVPLPGRAGREMRDGSLLAGPGADLGVTDFGEWLATLSE